jgi:squalene cyclase
MVPAIPLLFFLAASPEQRAVDYLAREVEKWPRENHCFSCHNNADAVRALTLAGRKGYVVPPAAMAESIEWLKQPANWNESKGNPGFSDTKLAKVQFAAAATEARLPLADVAEVLLPLQDADGSWRIDTGGLPGAPAIYGTALATYMSRRTLEAADATRFSGEIARANRWLGAQKPSNMVDAAAVLLAFAKSKAALDFILAAQTSDGGWGSQRGVPAEPFDTALALLALQAAGETKPIARGREFLLKTQQSAGGWQETTRPAGGTSYAEHISTTGWVLYALLATGTKGK